MTTNQVLTKSFQTFKASCCCNADSFTCKQFSYNSFLDSCGSGGGGSPSQVESPQTICFETGWSQVSSYGERIHLKSPNASSFIRMCMSGISYEVGEGSALANCDQYQSKAFEYRLCTDRVDWSNFSST